MTEPKQQKPMSQRDALTKAMEKTIIPFPAVVGAHAVYSYDVTRTALLYMGLCLTKSSMVASKYGGIPRRRLDLCVAYVNDSKDMAFPVTE